MSSGLVATMGLPANAATSGAEAAAPATAPIAVQPGMALQSGLLSAVGATDSSATELTAPAAAAVTFETGAFKAVPKSQGPSFDLGSFGSSKGASIVAIASRYLGVKYVYGGTTPNGWDCSGLTGYVYRLAGINLPRTANEQLIASTRISRDQAVPGDLVFFLSGGRAYHVGIYAGDNMMIDAGSTGHVTSKREIYSSSVVFGRF
ncbi:C40 family peptidase [Spongisporangium articulatum]|uniref:C40 family peptidase n=1 Tax=Spongisporangium articulatum TaxID=3362603 RepID=A0ABW8AGW4_9ACTN